MKYPNGYFKVKACKREGCGKDFTPSTPSQLYCSSECRGRNAYYMRVYGITQDEHKEMKTEHDGRCAICNGEGFLMGNNGHTEKLVVDHDHKTGKVRGLLCHNCNRGLGLFGDSHERLEQAVSYLQKHLDADTDIK